MTARLELQRGMGIAVDIEGRLYKPHTRRFEDEKERLIIVCDQFRPLSYQYGKFELLPRLPGQGAVVDGKEYPAGSKPLNKFGATIYFE